MVKLDTADAVLGYWGHSRHCSCGCMDTAAYLAYCVRAFEGLDDNHRTLFKQGCADASYLAECVRLRQAFDLVLAGQVVINAQEFPRFLKTYMEGNKSEQVTSSAVYTEDKVIRKEDIAGPWQAILKYEK
jgi:hypothetical protein